jgi:RHS repeat-associated protein
MLNWTSEAMETCINSTMPSAPPMPPLSPAANGKLASGISDTLTKANVWETRDFTPELRWGNDSMHARYYSPFLARFVSVDPVQGKVGGSQSWNRYSYVLNNPIALVDLDGENPAAFAVPAVLGGVALIAAIKATVLVSSAIGTALVIDQLIHSNDKQNDTIVVEPLQGFEPSSEEDITHPDLVPMTVLTPPVEGASANEGSVDSLLARSSTDGAGRNEPHGDSGRAGSKADQQIRTLEGKLRTATGRERTRIKNKIQKIKKAAAKSKKGDTDHRDTRQTRSGGN